MSIEKTLESRFISDYKVTKTGVDHETEKGTSQVIVGHARVIGFARDPKTEKLAPLVGVKPLGRPYSEILVEPQDMTAQKLGVLVSELGVVVLNESKLLKYLKLTQTDDEVLHGLCRTRLRTAGWLENNTAFYTGKALIHHESVDIDDFHIEPIQNAAFAVRGTLEEWKDNIGCHIARNPSLLGVSCIYLLSLFLSRLNLGTRLFNLWGTKGSGKTLASQCAATLFGNGIDPAAGHYSEDPSYVTKFSTTKNGIELVLARYTPLPTALDELTEQAVQTLRELFYKIASGQGKNRMTSQLTAAKANQWQTIVFATSEMAVAEAVSSTGKPLLGGQADRAIDLPADQLVLFEDFGEFGDFAELTRHLKQACGEYYGSAGEALIQYAVDNQDETDEILGLAAEAEELLMPANCGAGERRVVKCFAGALVAGYIAVSAGIFDCSPEDIEAAMKHLTDEWWRNRGGCLRRIADYLSAHPDDIVEGPPTLDSNAAVFHHNGMFTFRDWAFAEAFEDHRKMLPELYGLGALKREQAGRNIHRYCNNRFNGYSIYADRVLPLMEQAS